jgi:hypothetical protein
VAGTLLVVALSLGGFIYYQVNVRQRYVTREAMDEWRAAYERKWRGRVGAATRYDRHHVEGGPLP